MGLLREIGSYNNPFILLMEKILHQLRLVVPNIQKVLYIPGGLLDFFHQQ